MKMPDISLPHFSKFYIEGSDFKQSWIIAKNETIKSVRGKKFLVSAVIILLVFALITLIPIVLGKNIQDMGYGTWVSNYFSYVTMFVALIAALIGSVALVSEYEERTALIMFTRPVKKTSIFLGKFISSFVLCMAMMTVYYICVAILGFCYFQQISTDFFESWAMCMMYVFAAVSIAFLFSSVFKRGAIAIIATILLLVVVIPIISMMITGDKWYMLDIAGNSTLTCIPEYVATYNEAIMQITAYFDVILDLLRQAVEQHLVNPEYIDWTLIVKDTILRYMPVIDDPNLLRDAAVMLGWGLVSLVAAWFLFLRKQF